MPQVSRRLVSKEISSKILDLFLDCFYDLKNTKEVSEFIGDFLTPTEITMVAKRIAIAVMIARGYDYDTIKDALKVSDGTVATIKLKMAEISETTRKKIEKILRKEKIEKFFTKVDSLLNILPPKGGDWTKWRRTKWERKMKAQNLL